MNLEDLKNIIILLALIALIGAATSIALEDFKDSMGDSAGDNLSKNITENGLRGISNATEYLDTTGTIAGIAVLIGIVVLAFTFIRR